MWFIFAHRLCSALEKFQVKRSFWLSFNVSSTILGFVSLPLFLGFVSLVLGLFTPSPPSTEVWVTLCLGQPLQNRLSGSKEDASQVVHRLIMLLNLSCTLFQSGRCSSVSVTFFWWSVWMQRTTDMWVLSVLTIIKKGAVLPWRKPSKNTSQLYILLSCCCWLFSFSDRIMLEINVRSVSNKGCILVPEILSWRTYSLIISLRVDVMPAFCAHLYSSCINFSSCCPNLILNYGAMECSMCTSDLVHSLWGFLEP